MRIVQINANYAKSSIGRTTNELHKWLLDHGYTSYVFTPQYDAEDENVFLIGNKYDHRLHGFLSRLFGLQAYFSTLPTLSLIKQLREIKPDIIHLRNLHGNYINLPLLLKFIANNNIGCVVTLHDCWMFTGHCCSVKSGCAKWLTGCKDCPSLSEDNTSWFMDFSSKIYNDKRRLFAGISSLAILGNSKWTKRQAEQSILKDAKIVDYVYNWIDQEKFYPRVEKTAWNKLGIKQDEFTILGVCDGWSPKKGLLVFISIAKMLPECKIILVGGISGDIQLPSNIISIGKTHNNDELCEYYSHASVLLNPSVQETFGKVSAEALCCGTPIIVNNATANPELVGDGCGFIVQKNNVEEYIKYINIIRERGKQTYSEQCIKFASENFNKEQNILANIEIYKRLLS